MACEGCPVDCAVKAYADAGCPDLQTDEAADIIDDLTFRDENKFFVLIKSDRNFISDTYCDGPKRTFLGLGKRACRGTPGIQINL